MGNNSVKLPPAYCIKGGEEALTRTIKSLTTRSARYPLNDLNMWDEESENVVNTLYERGWEKLTGLLQDKINVIDSIKDKMNVFLDKGGRDCKYGLLGQSDLSQTEARSKELFMSVANPLYNIPEVADILFDDRIVNIAKCYFKSMPAVGTLNLRKSFANNLPDAQTTIFHCDKNSPYMLKFFLYLEDVDLIEDGPFTYVEGSAYEKPRNWMDSHRVPDETIENLYGKEKIKCLTAKKGDVLTAITTGYHKGQKVLSKDRTMLTLNFVCAPEDWTVKTQLDIKPESCAKLPAKHIPLLDFLYITE
jgi:hypothetical protein